MKHSRHINLFWHREDGSLMVFFAVSVIVILGIVALSFDLGRRASTQTDMQGYVDNVALAAAGELNGSPNAVINATQAANTVINAANERLKAGTAGQDFTISLDQIVFYEDLPDIDTPASFDPAQLSNPASANYKYRLPTSDLGVTPDPERARYVGIRLATVDVPWIFAGVFSASDLPGEAIGAVAVAGNTAWTCDLAPLLFCLPEDGAGGPLALNPGQAINLRTARQNGRWRPGEFGFASVDLDPTGPCAGLTDEAGRQACLITARTRVAACFQPERSDVEPGQRPFQESAAFNMSFDVYQDSMIQFFNEALYAPGPHSVRGLVPDASGDVCVPRDPSPDTMAFPLDDCHATACLDGRIGDGDWTSGRDEYVATNYSLPGADDDDIEDGTFFDFPEANLTRYGYYQREIERARRGGVMSAFYAGAVYGTDNDGGRGPGPDEDPLTEYTTWDDFWPDDFTRLNPIIPPAHNRIDDGLPQCNLNDTLPPRVDRRVLLAGGIHCPRGSAQVNGFDDNVEIVDFYRLFQLGPTENEAGFPPRFDLNVEVVERIPTADIGPYRAVVQLFR
ncbi:MAG: pilus assembly protein TadG-related protein [Pseudomonadota bacterium]